MFVLPRKNRILDPIDDPAGESLLGNDLSREKLPRITRCSHQRPQNTFTEEFPFMWIHVEDHSVVLPEPLNEHRRNDPLKFVQNEVRDPDIALDDDHVATRNGR